MLYFTRWKAMAIVLTALVICLFAVPNFLSEKMVASWPKWAQRHRFGPICKAARTSCLVDTKTCASMLESLRDDAPRAAATPASTGLVVRLTCRGAHPRGRQCRSGASSVCATVGAAKRPGGSWTSPPNLAAPALGADPQISRAAPISDLRLDHRTRVNG